VISFPPHALFLSVTIYNSCSYGLKQVCYNGQTSYSYFCNIIKTGENAHFHRENVKIVHLWGWIQSGTFGSSVQIICSDSSRKRKQATFSKRIHLLFFIIRFPNSKYIVANFGHGLAKFCGQLYFWFGGMVLIIYCSYTVCS
jgi:hypothetical protein